MINLLDSAQFPPDTLNGPPLHPTPENNPGGKNNDRQREDNKSDHNPGRKSPGTNTNTSTQPPSMWTESHYLEMAPAMPSEPGQRNANPDAWDTSEAEGAPEIQFGTPDNLFHALGTNGGEGAFLGKGIHDYAMPFSEWLYR